MIYVYDTCTIYPYPPTPIILLLPSTILRPQPRQVIDVWRMPQSCYLIGPAIIAGQNLRMLQRVLTVRRSMESYGVVWSRIGYVLYN